jgi:hypothetical protein
LCKILLFFQDPTTQWKGICFIIYSANVQNNLDVKWWLKRKKLGILCSVYLIIVF